ncbi:MAG TPA: hypothetical protein VIJ39_09205 [Solirubrobacteraceae bacterium]
MTGASTGRGEALEAAGSFGEKDALSNLRESAPLVGLCVLVGAALVAIALGVSAARENRPWGETLYWGGLLVVIVPCAARLAGHSVSRGERLALIVLIGLALLAVEWFVAPLSFNNHDEFGHLRETYDIFSTSHLISYNPIQTEYSYFPGIELATSAFSHISGLSIFLSWKLILVALRIMEVLTLFLIFERPTSSPRIAGLGVLVYMCNPSFMYFDAHFSYESFALPFGLLLIQRASAFEERSSQWASWILFGLILVALTVSHHLASYITVGVLVLLALAEQVWRRRTALSSRVRRRTVALFAVTGLVVVSAWTALVAPVTISKYLGPVLSEAVSSTVGFATGTHAAEKTLFEAQNKQASPLLEQALGFAAVGLLLVLLTWGVWRLWRSGRLSSPLPSVLACIAVVYPATLLFRLTLNGSETSDRASAYAYLGLGYVVAAGVFGSRSAREADKRFVRRVLRWVAHLFALPAPVKALAVSLTIALLFVGGVLVGTARTERLPGPYYPAVTARAGEDAESIAAARWADGHLAHHQALLSDIVNRLLMSSYGRENTVCCYVDDQLVPEIFLTPTFTAKDARLIGLDHISLLVVDRRLEEQSPSTHLFFERSDGGPYYKPLSPAALAKFEHVPGIDQLFDSGNIAIYDTSKLGS